VRTPARVPFQAGRALGAEPARGDVALACEALGGFFCTSCWEYVLPGHPCSPPTEEDGWQIKTVQSARIRRLSHDGERPSSKDEKRPGSKEREKRGSIGEWGSIVGHKDSPRKASNASSYTPRISGLSPALLARKSVFS